jgi:ribosomal protein S27AE
VTEKEKVVKGLEICSAGEWNSTGGRDHTDCPYYPAGYTGCTCKLLMRDALALLKGQEPKLVHVTADISHRKIGECPTCGKLINSGDYPNYCGRCGQAVKWE